MRAGLLVLLAATVLGIGAAGARDAGPTGCVDANGNTFFGDLDEPRNFHPEGACLPQETWDAIRAQARRQARDVQREPTQPKPKQRPH